MAGGRTRDRVDLLPERTGKLHKLPDREVVLTRVNDGLHFTSCAPDCSPPSGPALTPQAPHQKKTTQTKTKGPGNTFHRRNPDLLFPAGLDLLKEFLPQSGQPCYSSAI